MSDGIVTGEGVLLDARPTSFASRVLASIVDVAAIGVAAFLVLVIVGQTSFTPSEAFVRIALITTLATVTVIVPTTVETLTRGRSLGKLVAGIRIVRDDGGPVRFRQALVRALVGFVELWSSAGSIALICSIVHPQGKRVGDLLAGTYAVRVRGKAPARTAVPMPPQLAAWANAADVRRLPDGLALSVRQFLARTGTLHPASRVQLGTQLAAEVGRYVAPLPPVGTHPEYFLAAVLAERREREHAVGRRTAQRAADESALLARLPHGVPDPVD
jgi:uncharacterized RDD family membrane protein YckC